MSADFLSSIFVVAATLVCCVILLHPKVLASTVWRATVTPLASIIGSGFLVIAPILLRHFGYTAALVMLALCGFAYAIGAAIRFNILALDSTSEDLQHPFAAKLELSASWALAVAYVISVCYYLNLFGAFAVSLTGTNDPMHSKLITTAMLMLIAMLGWSKGLSGLEKAEELTVALKLAVIGGLLVGMSHFAIDHKGAAFFGNEPQWTADSWRVAIGLLITVQGFETSRYLSEGYSAKVRVRTMQWAQWISTAIYVIYIALASANFSASTIGSQETAIIQMTEHVAPILPLLLVAAALAAQFSAAVADTNGCVGLVREVSQRKLPARAAYVVLVVVSIALTWLANIFQIISIASRIFAFYYALQCILAAVINNRKHGPSVKTFSFIGLAALALVITLFGLSPE